MEPNLIKTILQVYKLCKKYNTSISRIIINNTESVVTVFPNLEIKIELDHSKIPEGIPYNQIEIDMHTRMKVECDNFVSAISMGYDLLEIVKAACSNANINVNIERYYIDNLQDAITLEKKYNTPFWAQIRNIIDEEAQKIRKRYEDRDVRLEQHWIQMRNRKQKTYLIYDNNMYKIGRSIEPENRLKQIKAHNPAAKLICTIDKDIEKELHNKYKNKRVGGEWFDLTESDISYIAGMQIASQK